MSDRNIFKKCPKCGTEWHSRDDFLADPTLELNGYQADFRKLEHGLFLFTHKYLNCFTTMAIRAKDFLDLYKGRRYHENRALTADCPRYCIDERQLGRCEAFCECAFVREVIQIVIQRQKSGKGIRDET